MGKSTLRRTLSVRPALAVAVWVVAGGCGGSLGPEDLAHIERADGNNQETFAGTAVPIPPSVRALSKDGEPIPGAVITFTVTDGGGSLTGAQATSNTDGIAAVSSWILGTEVGQNVLNATAELAPERIPFIARGTVGPPAIIEKIDGDDQMVTAGLSVPVPPTVRVTDQFSNPVPDLDVSFAIGEGGGSVEAMTATTDVSGVANVRGWTLGGAPGNNTLVVTAGAVTETFNATGVPGPVAIAIATGDSQTTTVGTPVSVDPQVLVTDGLGLAVSGVTVSFTVAMGGGSVDAQMVNTDAGGLAAVQWTAGTKTGTNKLTASVEGVGDVTFNAEGIPDVPATIVAVGGDAQYGEVGKPLPAPPSVRLRDQYGNVIPDQTVTFVVTSGGGSIQGSPATTGADGVASAGAWTLGPSEGPNTVDATVSGLAPLTFTANALAQVFNIEMVRLGAGGPAVAQALADAAARWQQVIIGDLVDESFVNNPADSAACGVPHPPINDVVDDLRIYVLLEAIDGAGNVLGNAGPCFIRDSDSLTVVGVMRLDTDDIPNLDATGRLVDVIVHEIGHALGFGTLWDDFGLLANPSLPNNLGADTHFTGLRAIDAFDSVGGTSYNAGAKVPVENTQGGAGTRDSHWRESLFMDELMTGYIDANNPMSVVTVESLADLGYVVNSNGADPYALPNTAAARALSSTRSSRISLVDDVRHGPIYMVRRDGTITAVIQR